MKKKNIIDLLVIAFLSIFVTGFLTEFQYKSFTYNSIPYPGKTPVFFSVDVSIVFLSIFCIASLIIILLRFFRKTVNNGNKK